MQPGFDQELSRRIEDIRSSGLYRELRRVGSPQSTRIQIDGRWLTNFSSNDYLGLANSEDLKTAAAEAAARWGAGSGASRLICGSLGPHHELEEQLAEFKKAEAALTFCSGYTGALGTITALVGKHDLVIVDKLVHACIVDAARLSGATLRVFRHNDIANLEEILKWAAARFALQADAKPAILIITESVFSMDGDIAPLREIVKLKDKFGAWLMVDEAHATGLYGPNRGGLAEELGVSDSIEVQMGTLGKALGSAGGYICGSRTLIDYLVNRARSFIFSTAPVPAAAAAATAAIRCIRSDRGQTLCASLWECIHQFTSNHGRPCRSSSAIVPIHIGPEEKAILVAANLRRAGFFIPAIRYPTVARGEARLRVTLTAAHHTAEVRDLLRTLSENLCEAKSQAST